ncbi:MAG: serine aminopeptidase domain-containing protein [Caldicoprobacterales bacterium]
MAEWAGRYDEFASRLAASGYLVYANDHRGHGKTAKDVDSIGFLGNDSFNGMVRDLKLIHDFIKSENTGLPVYFVWTQHGLIPCSKLCCQIRKVS